MYFSDLYNWLVTRWPSRSLEHGDGWKEKISFCSGCELDIGIFWCFFYCPLPPAHSTLPLCKFYFKRHVHIHLLIPLIVHGSYFLTLNQYLNCYFAKVFNI